MKKYDTYKDSGIEWLGEIPEHWEAIKIQYLANDDNSLFIDGDWIESSVIEETGIRYLTTGNIGAGFYKEQGSGFISEKTFIDLNCTEVYPGDLIISRLNEPIGRACIIPDLGHRIVISVDNVILRPKKGYHIGFLKHLMNSVKYSNYTSLIARGATMKRISRGLLGRIRLPIPSFNEQNIIASFLDHKTTQIDTLIEKKEQLVEKLTLKRQAIINEAVTKGLNPNVPMKDSGIEWLGEIPEHWEVTKLKFLGDSITGITYSPDDIVDDCENAKLVLRSSNIQEGKLNLENNVFVNKKINSKYLIRKGDILICSRNGSRNLIGKNIKIGSRVEGETWGAFMTVYRSVYNDFIYYFFNSQIFKALSSLFLSSTINQLTIGVLNNFVIAIPLDSKEQEGIVIFLKNKTEEFDNAIEKIKKTIDKLKLYRQSLISEAVTGKIDLRDWKQTDNK